MQRGGAARDRSSGSPTVRGGWTSTRGGSAGFPWARLRARRGESRARCSMAWSSSRSLSLAGCLASLIADYGDEQVGDAGSADVAERGELLTIGAIEEQDGATEDLTLVNGLERACCGRVVGKHHQFYVAGLEFFHAAVEDDATAIDEHDVGEDILNLFYLMGGYEDGAAAIEVVVEQRIVELLAIEDVEAEGW